MPRFFFDVQNGDRYARDDRGIDLPHVNCVWKIAVAMGDDVAKAEGRVSTPQAVSVVVRDASGATVYRSERAAALMRGEVGAVSALNPFTSRG